MRIAYRQFTEQLISKRARVKLDPKMDFKFFIMKAKVCSVYREAL